jgi:hypothetical protein
MFVFVGDLHWRGIRFAALAHIVGWVKRITDTIYVGFAHINPPQQFEIATKLANPTRLVADPRLNPTYDLFLCRPSRPSAFWKDQRQRIRKNISASFASLPAQ